MFEKEEKVNVGTMSGYGVGTSSISSSRVSNSYLYTGKDDKGGGRKKRRHFERSEVRGT